MRDDSWYDVAQICLNGHIINDMAQSSPEMNKRFCDECGAKTITECPHCKAPIRGHYHVPHVGSVNLEEKAPKFCHNCGKPYPWTESKIKAAQDLASEINNLTPEERDVLKQSLDDLVRDTPNVQVAALRFKKLVAGAGKTITEAFKSILVDIVSETVKKLIWP